VKTGDVITYSLSLSVTGGPVSNVTVTDVLPEHLRFVSFGTLPAGTVSSYNLATRTLNWDLGTLPVGTIELTLDVQVDPYVREGTELLNCARASFEGMGGQRESCVDVELARIYTVKVGVYNAAGELVREVWVQRLSERIEDFSVVENPAITSLDDVVYVEYEGVRIATWDGTNKVGDPVTNGRYHLKIDSVDAYGVAHSVSKEVMVSRSIAKVGVKVYNAAGEVVRDLYTFMEDPCGRGGVTGTPTPCRNPLSEMTVSTKVLKPVAQGTPGPNGELRITSEGGLDVTWDGKGEDGAPVQSGHYEVEVHYTDGLGGEETVSVGVVVQGGTREPSAGYLTASPNLLKGGQTTTTIMVNDPAAGEVRVNLYNVAGELIKKARATSDQVTLDFAGLSSGLYFAVTEVRDLQGKFLAKKTLKISFIK
jgi:uncharacterized repeat protein (TIGR01451 family)